MTTIRFGTSVISNAGLEEQNQLDFTDADGNTELTGANHHIQNRNLYAFIDTAEGGAAAGNPTFQSSALEGAEFAQKLADMGYGGRTADIGNENTAADIVRITSHGLVNNNTLGSLTGAHGGVSFHGDAHGFGVDNAPESGGRWLNTGDSLDFAVNAWQGVEQAIKTFSFVVNVNPGTTGRAASDVVIDFDGDVVDYNAAWFAARGIAPGSSQLVGNMNDTANSRTVVDGFVLAGVAHNSTVTLDFEAKTVTVNGATTAMSDEMYAAFAAGGIDNVTVGGRHNDGLGFSIRDLAIDTVDSFLGAALEGKDVLSLGWYHATTNGGPTQNSAELRTTLDLGGDGSINSTDDIATWTNSGGRMGDIETGSQVVLDNELLRMTAFGEFDAAIPGSFEHQTGSFLGAFQSATAGIAVDTGGGAASSIDGSSLGGNYGDTGPAHMENGEFIRFELLTRDAAQVTFALNFIADGAEAVNDSDVVVRLYDGAALLETRIFELDEDASIVVADNLGQAFDRVEIGTIAGSGLQMRIADADFVLI